MTPQKPLNLNSNALLLRQIGETLFGETWPNELSSAIGVSDRSMRRWSAGTDVIPHGVLRDIHWLAESRWTNIKYFDDELVKLMMESEISGALTPTPNAIPQPDQYGIFFTMQTDAGRPVRCYVRREVLDDRVRSDRFIKVLDYFREHADVFYGVAQRKFDAGEYDGDIIAISNDDVADLDLPDIR